MKKLAIITSLFVLAFFSKIDLQAQSEDLYSYMEQYLNADEKDQIARAKSTFEKGHKQDSKIKEEDSKTDKYFAKKSKKGEKKSVDAKTLRISQAIDFEKAYGIIYSVYTQKISEGVYVYQEDEAKVNKMVEDASADNASAAKKLKPYKSVSPKDLKKNITYSKLKSDIQGMMSLYESSIKKLIEGYTVIVDQQQKKQLDEEENRAWQNAQSDNTLYSYQNYLNTYKDGKHAKEAQDKIAELNALEEKKKRDDAKRSLTNVQFRVQIAASKNKLSAGKLKSIYKVTKEIEIMNLEGWYKYFVGTYKTYDDAKKFVKANGKKGFFVVAFRDGKKIDIKEVVSSNENK